MTRAASRERTVVLVKAQPHVGAKHGETVCCAGIDGDGNWRRLYPVVFRDLAPEQKFGRWDWISYDWRPPRTDKRPESRHVQVDTLTRDGRVKDTDRAGLLARALEPSTEVAASKGKTLTLIRPLEPNLKILKKPESQISDEQARYARAVQQFGFFTESKEPLRACPFTFRYEYRDEAGKLHTSTLDDWETVATFWRTADRDGTESGAAKIQQTFGIDYPRKGMVFAMGTNSRRPNQWLLVGILRFDPPVQGSLL